MVARFWAAGRTQEAPMGDDTAPGSLMLRGLDERLSRIESG
jgi:hypothetical protein